MMKMRSSEIFHISWHRMAWLGHASSDWKMFYWLEGWQGRHSNSSWGGCRGGMGSELSLEEIEST